MCYFSVYRAVKSVLVMAGSLKRDNPTLSEDITLVQALRDCNLPKFLAEDSILFQVRIMNNFSLSHSFHELCS
jgi:dynein heavy chain